MSREESSTPSVPVPSVAEMEAPSSSEPWAASVARPRVVDARRVVVKVGTRALFDGEGRLDRRRISEMVATVSGVRHAGKEALLVSSGAVGVGRVTLGEGRFPAGAEAWAAVGQSVLTGIYQRAFDVHGIRCGQMLLSQRDFDDRDRGVKLASTLGTLLRQGVVPVLNENDAVELGRGIETEEGPRTTFPDNDRLAALVAGLLGADLLVVLTDVPGVYDRDPSGSPAACLIETLTSVDEGVEVGAARSQWGRGGMASKLSSASVAARGGCGVVIASGREPGALSRILGGEAVGTWIPPSGQLQARDRWIAFSPVSKGRLEIDAGAVGALRERGASLLATGVRGVSGTFRAGDVIELVGPEGPVGRARIRHDAVAVRDWLRIGGQGITLIRRSDIVLEVPGRKP